MQKVAASSMHEVAATSQKTCKTQSLGYADEPDLAIAIEKDVDKDKDIDIHIDLDLELDTDIDIDTDIDTCCTHIHLPHVPA